MRIREAKEKFQSYHRGTGTTNHGHEWLDESENSILARIAFFRWASQINSNLSAYDLNRFRYGGREHLVLAHPSYCIKATNPPVFGYSVDLDPEAPGLTPCQDPVKYLDRFIVAEEIWGLKTEFLGVVGDQSKYSILVQQDWIFGPKATFEEIRHCMTMWGFYEITKSFGHENSLSFYNEEFGIFDLRPANVVKLLDGSIIPIDCFVERLDAQKIEYMEQLRKP